MKDISERNRVFTLASENIITLKEAASLLGLSYRQAQRIHDTFIESNQSIESLKFRRSHPAWNRLDPHISNKILELKDIHPDISNYHLANLLEDQISRTVHPSTIRKILIRAGKYIPNPDQKRRGRKHFEKEQAGELVQMDTSQHRWLHNSKKDTYLIAIIDDYSRVILAARIFDANTAWNNMLVIREAIEKYGLFKILYTNNASMFKLIRQHISRHFEYKTDLEKVQTQIHRALSELNILLIPHEPFQTQCKGKIERLFAFIQSRFTIMAKDCKNLEELNNVLQKWIEWYNTKHIHSITEVIPQERLKNNVFRHIPKNIDLDNIFCFKENRIVKNDNTFEFQGETYQITNFTHRICWAKAKITLHIIPEKFIRAFHNSQFIQQFEKNNVHPNKTFLMHF